MEIKPFRAYRFDKTTTGNDSACFAPPYDVIADDFREVLYKKSPYNIVRITKGKTQPTDNQQNNQYTRAAAYLTDWINKGILKQDTVDTIYGYVQDFRAPQTDTDIEEPGIGHGLLQRISFICRGKLEDFGKVVKPHEQVLSKPITDRFNLKKATKAEFGLVFMLYEDDKHTAENIIRKKIQAAQQPLADYTDEQNVRHRIYAITDQKEIAAITQALSDKSCIIADGHHRYTTGLNYYKQTSDPAAAHQMFGFCNTCQQGLIVLATHRLVGKLEELNFQHFISELGKDFKITQLAFKNTDEKTAAREKMLDMLNSEFKKGDNAFGIYGKDNAFYVAVLKNKSKAQLASPEKSKAWQSLDVSVLHKVILEPLLGIDDQVAAGGENLKYVKGIHDAVDGCIADVDTGSWQIVFLLNPTRFEQLKGVTDAGERMPQKSTFFYPKLYSGLTIQKL